MTPDSLGPIYDRLTRIEVTQEQMAEDVKDIKAQTTKTNGRVTGIEKWRARVEVLLESTDRLKDRGGTILAGVLTGALTGAVLTALGRLVG